MTFPWKTFRFFRIMLAGLEMFSIEKYQIPVKNDTNKGLLSELWMEMRENNSNFFKDFSELEKKNHGASLGSDFQ